MRNAVVGLVAHVDAGKTTLAEALLFEAGAIRRQGRVDRGDAHLDCDAQERERGITIFSKQTALDHAGVHLMFIDAPGHVDFSAEAERTLQALDYAVLVVSGTDGVQSHTETMGELLERYGVPLFVFVNKMDLNAPAPAALLAELQQRVTSACLDGASLMAALDASTAPEAARVLEDAAATDEVALDEYLETGSLVLDTVRRLVAERKVAPVFFGSALKLDGTAAFLDALSRLVAQKTWPDAFGGRVYKVSRNARGERLAWVKVTGGELRAKSVVEGVSGASAWEEKIDQVRIYDADTYQTVTTVPAGCVCAVTGLTRAVPGSALGVEPAGEQPALAPVLSYRIEPQGCDMSAVAHAARELADEDPLLGVAWEEELQELHVQLMGEVQAEVLQRLLADRYGLAVAFSEGGVLYRETLTAPARGVGHFEPLCNLAVLNVIFESASSG